MLALVLAADLITLFIAWELVGLCSYLLIGFWFERPGVPAAASKAFFTTRLADLAFLAGVLFLIGMVGNGRIDAILSASTHGKIVPGFLLALALLVFAGAAGKSAQFPFQGWLPDAMLGPTPVSALIHSATMVAAGVFLVARLYPLFLVAGPVLQVVAWVGVITALLGGAAALVESDLKRTLAYSTMSQIGLMFVGLGSGSLLAGVFLLLAQALYKATLFLASGAIDHAVSSTAFERMGGLAQQAHEAKRGLLIPLLVLVGLVPLELLANAALLGHPLDQLLGTMAPDVPVVTIIALGIAVIGAAAGLWARRTWPALVVWPQLQGVTPLFVGEFGLKVIYRLVARLGFLAVAGLGVVDRRVFDAFAHTLARATLAAVRASARFDARRIDAAVRELGQGILAFSQRVRALQTGRIENYLLLVFVWGLGVIAIAVLAAVAR